jgi:replicative DNA helicase
VYADKLPPHNIDAEEAVIGSLLIDGASIHKIAAILQPADFYGERNRAVYESCVNLFRRGEAINQITVAQELAGRGKLESSGGAAYLSHLIAICPTPLDIEHYAQIVYRLSMMRELIGASSEIARIGYESGPDVEDSMARAEAALFRLRRRQGTHDLTHIRQVLDKYFEAVPTIEEGAHLEQLPYVLSRFGGLDEFLGGFQRADLVIIAGRPSMGKTSLALSIARNVAVEQKSCVALFSLEMARESVVSRLLASESGVNMRRLRYEQHSEEEERRLIEATGVLSESPIYIDDTPMLKVAEMHSKALRLHYEHPIDVIIIDYLQLMSEGWRGENRVQELSYITRSLKGLAREINAPVIAVSQLSRAVEGRESHIPRLSDLRESGSIEQDADIVLFIYRDEYYQTEDQWNAAHQQKGQDQLPYPREEADIIIAKNRNGPTGQVKLRFHRNLARFYSIVSEEPTLT